jgi:hypothetical protein
MNRQQLTYLLLAGVIIGGLALFMARRGAASYQTTTQLLGQRVLPEFPMNEVAHIHIRDATNELNLVRQDERWRVQERHNYPADFTAISGLLQKFWDMKIVQAEDVGPSQLPRLQLADPRDSVGTGTGTLLGFRITSGDEIASLLLGRQHMRQGSDPSPMGGGTVPDGRYLRVLNGSGRVVLVSDALSEVTPNATRYLNKDFFRVEKINALTVTPPNSVPWRLVKEVEGGSWQLVNSDVEGHQSLDSAKTSFANNVLAYPSFVDVIDPDRPAEETGMDQPWVVEIATFEGLHYTAWIGSPNQDEQYHFAVAVRGDYPRERVPAENESQEDRERLDREFQAQLTRLDEKLMREKQFENWIYLVSKWTVDPLLKSRNELLADAPANGESGFEMEDEMGGDFDFEGLDLESLGIFPNQ